LTAIFIYFRQEQTGANLVELNIERIAMIAALIVMGGAVIVKIVTMQLMKAMQRSIEVVNQSRIKAVRELSKAQSRKNITASEQQKLVSRRKKIRKKIRTLKSELLSFKKAEAERQKQRAAARDKK